MARAWHVASLSSAMAILAGCAGEAHGEGRSDPPPALVEVGEVTEGTLHLTRRYLGEVRALSRAELAAGAAGEIRSVTVREGDRVEAGAVLVRLDPRLAQAQLRAAQAARRQSAAENAQATRDAERFGRAGPQTVAAVEIERAESAALALRAENESLEAEEQQAREQLSRHRVLAPFAGVISARNVDPGDWVAAGTPVLELVADEQTEVLLRVEPDLLEDLHVGDSATVRRRLRETAGEITGIVRAVDPTTRTAQLRVRASAPWLIPGVAAEVELAVERAGEGWLVPRDAVVDGVAETRVIRVVDGKAQPVTVNVLERGTTHVRVRGEGLEVGAAVVVRGNERLRPEQAVTVGDS
ncbi:MAG: efflux RND transporter periplasmic adaptor subunit [Myxococcota bacterium]